MEQRFRSKARFEVVHVKLEGRAGTRSANRIYCSLCTNHDDSTGTNLAPPDVARKQFQARGWEVGGHAKHDLCPACVAARDAARRAQPKLTLVPVQHTDADGIIHHDMELKDMDALKQTGPGNVIVRAVDPPREMDRDSRRLVFEKINELYVDTKTGYDGNWTDKKIAENLGCPAAWVKAVREEFFGPEANEATTQARAILTEIENKHAELSKTTGDLIRAKDALQADITRAITQMNALADRLDVHRKIIGKL